MPKFSINYNIYGTINITAKDEESARELAQTIKKDEWMDHLSDELNSGSLELGTIEKI